MDVRIAQRIAAGACVAMALVLVLYQFVLTPGNQAPTFLFILFTGLWLFGAAMLQVAPMFGAVGTAAWGLISALGAARTHGMAVGGEGLVLIIGSLVGGGLAVWFLTLHVRGLGAD